MSPIRGAVIAPARPVGFGEPPKPNMRADHSTSLRQACAGQTGQSSLLGNHFCRREGGDDFFEARIAAERVPIR
jgi:hypothetical protein